MSRNPDHGDSPLQDETTSGSAEALAGSPSAAAQGDASPGGVGVAEDFAPAGTSGEPPSGGGGWGEEPEAPGQPRMSFLDHLEELRQRIIRSLIAITVGFVLCWTFADEIYAGLAGPIVQVLHELNLPEQLVYTNPTGPFTLYVQMALLAGVFVAAPYVLLQVWGFISPGLYPHEKRYAMPFVLLCSVLFISGGAFAYFIAFPAALRFLLTFAHQFQPMITVNEYFGLAITIILGLALVFELPVLILLLTLLRIVTPGFLLRNLRYAVLLIFVAAAVISPSADVPNMMLFAAPMLLLYFFGIGLSWLVIRMRRRREEA
jgi:sec-independent protein translocase protein TatC